MERGSRADSRLLIRVAGVDDAENLFQVQRASALAAFGHIFPPNLYPFPDEAERTRWNEYLRSNGRTVLIAEFGSRPPVGVVVLSDNVIERLFVHPDHWGEGVGTRLHDEAVARFRRQGFSVCKLWVLEKNHQARRFYENRGWRIDGRKRESPFPPNPIAIGYTLTLIELSNVDVG